MNWDEQSLTQIHPHSDRRDKALKQVLETYDISQNKLAVTMGIARANVHRWVHEQRDPAGDVIVDIKNVLKQLNQEAAEVFVQLFLGD